MAPESSTILLGAYNGSNGKTTSLANGANDSLRHSGRHQPAAGWRRRFRLAEPTALPTGSITVYDNGTAISTNPLDSTGTAFFSSSLLIGGSHSLTFSYNRRRELQVFDYDQSAGAFNLTVTKGATTMELGASEGYCGGCSPLTAGSSLLLEMGCLRLQWRQPECLRRGNLVFTAGNLTQTVPLQPQGAGPEDFGGSYGTAIFTNMAVGTYVFSISYAGDSNWQPASLPSYMTVPVVGAAPLLPDTLTLTLSPRLRTPLRFW